MKAKQAVILGELTVTKNMIVTVKYESDGKTRTVTGRTVNFDENTLTVDVSERYNAKQERISVFAIAEIYDAEEYITEEF